MLLLVLFKKTTARATRPGSNRVLYFYRNLSAVAAVEAAVAAARQRGSWSNIQQQPYISAEHHISRGGEQGRGCRQGCIMRRNGPCYLALYAVSAGNIRDNK